MQINIEVIIITQMNSNNSNINNRIVYFVMHWIKTMMNVHWVDTIVKNLMNAVILKDRSDVISHEWRQQQPPRRQQHRQRLQNGHTFTPNIIHHKRTLNRTAADTMFGRTQRLLQVLVQGLLNTINDLAHAMKASNGITKERVPVINTNY